MKHWTQKELIENGYEIENAQITNVSLNMENHGCLCLDLTLEWSGSDVYMVVMFWEKDTLEQMIISSVVPQKAVKQLCGLWTRLENRNF